MSDRFDSMPHLARIAALYRADEAKCLEPLLLGALLPQPARLKVAQQADRWISDIRQNHKPSASVNDLLSRFGLSSHEGLALMCLAEALLRIPDRITANALIRDKLTETHWTAALGTNVPWAVNATGWALSLTGKVIEWGDIPEQGPGAALGRLVARLGQPVIREAIKAAMEWLADQFVTGETIHQALHRMRPLMNTDVRFSFDMLGEGARAAQDAEHYHQAYMRAIEAIGQFQDTYNFRRASGVSVKLSALHPRYEMAQRDRVMQELLPRVTALCEKAARYNIPLTIDAEETDRLHLSIDVIAELMEQPALGDWEGLGFAVQAYQKRAPAVIDCFVALARHRKRRIHIRLVKGAYWDSEIKRTQERGLDDFPVFTRKASTDVSYHACARRMLEADDIVNSVFGTHNALTVAHIAEMAGTPSRVEFQRLHGMGDDLYALLEKEGFHTCIYAPVGNHDVLLGYLVRRILENGANSSFVHRLLDPSVPVADLIADPVETVRGYTDVRHPHIRRPADLYRPERPNSLGLELNDPFSTTRLLAEMEPHYALASSSADVPQVIEDAFIKTTEGYQLWSTAPVEVRALCLDQLASLLEQNRAALMALLVAEGKKTIPDALNEVREAIDFCHYYAVRARIDCVPVNLGGPTGEQNMLQLTGRGVFVCISPWNFPLAIFIGQVVAALVVGNCVIAKPAPQTPHIAAYAASLLYKAGVPLDVFRLVTGGADTGAALIDHPLVAGVAFTGSTTAARNINRSLANKNGPIVPLIAETGGQNALIVDSSALPEQVVDDVVTSAFRSAGQRCSALRVLCLPESTADKILMMLKGAMRELRLGDPAKLDTDIAPVIDKTAHHRLHQHIDRLKNGAKEIYSCEIPFEYMADFFIAPQVWEIPAISWLTGEVFGPILHVVRYRPENMTALIGQINATGFGLTGGIHSRIESTVQQVRRELHVGNLYVNRSLIGAVVGVQPFGGEGLSGTGPKAGGPHYLARFALERVVSINTTAAGGNASLLAETSA